MSSKLFKNFSIYNMKNAGLRGYVYDFSVDSDFIPVDDILDIYKYFKKFNGLCVGQNGVKHKQRVEW